MKVALVLMLLLVGCPTAQAGAGDSARTDPVPAADSIPTTTDVLARLYAFDAFQQQAIDRTAPLPSSDVQNTAELRADAAAKRDKELDDLQNRAGRPADRISGSALKRADGLADVDSSEGPLFVRRFYAAQLVQYQLIVGVLESYLQAPDDEALKTFVTAQLPRLRAELEDTQAALAEK